VSATQPNDLDERVFAQLISGFPVSESPYCDLGVLLGADEIDVLSAALNLRECGRIACVAAEFADLEGFSATASQDDADLAFLISADLPTGEHPFDEIAAQLQLRGVDQTADWVLERVRGWVADGTVLRVAAQAA